MKNSLLQDQPYSEIIALRNYFNDIYLSKVRSLLNKDDKKLDDIIKNLDEIIMLKYSNDANNYFDHSYNIGN